MLKIGATISKVLLNQDSLPSHVDRSIEVADIMQLYKQRWKEEKREDTWPRRVV